MGGVVGNWIGCRVCGYGFKQITSSHLRKHGLTIAQYRDRFPDAPLQDESIIMRGDRNSFWGRKHSGESKRRMSESASASFTAERRARLSVQMTEQNRKHWSDPASTYNSDAYRDLLSTSVQKYWNSEKSNGHRIANSELLCQLRPEYAAKLQAVWDSYSSEDRQKRIDKVIDAFVAGGASKESRGERQLRKLLEENYAVDAHKWVRTPDGDRFNVDMYVQELDAWVEFDGVYWHGLDRPIGLIQESGTPTDQVIFKKWQRDRRQDVYFKEKCWTLIRITDLEFKRDPESCLERIEKGGY